MGSRILAERYELLEKIGDGGMAVVYKAKDRLLNRFVAVKILKPEFTKDIKFIESFRRESQAAASLNHPNIVSVYDVGREGNINFIVMELIEGNTLSQIINKNGPLETARALNIAKQVASALSVAHKNQIIHRDVKPHNILITQDGTAKITDFGIAKAVSSSTIVGATSTIMGSVHYFSPEQARGGYIDEKSDIYSLGIVIYEMLTGKVPFDGDNPVAVAIMHMNEDMPMVSASNPNVPPMVEAVVMKATDKYQVNRFKSADEMYEALERASFSLLGLKGDGSEYMHNGLDATITMAAVNGNSREHDASPGEEGGADELDEDQVDEDGKGKKGKKFGKARKDNGKGSMKDGKNKKKVKVNKMKVLAIVLALICAIPASQFLLSAFGEFGKDKEVTVPSVVGLTEEEAIAAIEKVGLKYEINDSVMSPDYPEGVVSSQDPEADMVVSKKNTTVILNVSKKTKAGTIPDVTNAQLKDAEFLLKSYGYKVGEITEEESDIQEGLVISQTPKGGKEGAEGSKVNLVVSKGSGTEAKMPNLLGLTKEKAQADLREAGLKLGSVSEEQSSAYTQGTVMWQQYGAGEALKKDQAVNIRISSGATPAAPKTVAMTIDYSTVESTVVFLTVVVTDETGTRTIINGEQRTKDMGSEVITFSGQGKGNVRVIFDNDIVMEKAVDFNTGTIS
ncbi:MAG: Stk1 family PASTA domain-containing Ser/Thr kinase [Anaerovorax sp.]